ncbi:HlyU family transcriptional regulator [Reinekea thalattae]|uniref:Transcriptional regulator n=1 Tax=Reinekea thalattae TaxID=2593301 RepID=A0A5C8ZA56_9GAMM|nr:HlyU family transcriptional regulator [Reinekea thalattae]TXR54842.1 transcriptional regulator [Reinekea thalattae]
MFGWFKKSPAAPVKQVWVEHNGFRICATPIAEAGQYRVSGIIEKGEDEAVKQHRFVRADLIANKDEADAFSVLKAKLMIDQMGDAIFSDD